MTVGQPATMPARSLATYPTGRRGATEIGARQTRPAGGTDWRYAARRRMAIMLSSVGRLSRKGNRVLKPARPAMAANEAGVK